MTELEVRMRMALEDFIATPDTHLPTYETAYKEGFWAALETFGIWKDGHRTIGCLDTPIMEAYEKCFPGSGPLPSESK